MLHTLKRVMFRVQSLMASIVKMRCVTIRDRRPPDNVIGGDDPYLLRWYLIPRNRFFNVYLHVFLRDDDDRAFHDHPWRSISLMLDGMVGEFFQAPDGEVFRTLIKGDIVCRSAEFSHRLVVLERPAMTLFITGPRVREWGFHCPNGWRHWEEFTSPTDSGQIGRGCE